MTEEQILTAMMAAILLPHVTAVDLTEYGANVSLGESIYLAKRIVDEVKSRVPG